MKNIRESSLRGSFQYGNFLRGSLTKGDVEEINDFVFPDKCNPST